uniref:Uncharacterized protein n=1 Tax=Biomphalaria glabrata TaxID=6526 RepID=A0A2C9K955_BIOGL
MNLEPHQIPATESPAVLENTNALSHDSERFGHSDTDFEKNSTENVVPGPQSLTESGYVTYPSSVDVTVTGSVILEGNTSLHQYYPSRNIRPSQELEETVCNDNQNLPESHGENDAAVHFVESGNHWMKSSVTVPQEVALKFKKVKSSCASALSSWPDWNVDDEEDQMSIDSFSENVVMDSHSQGEPQEISDGTKKLNSFTEILHDS